MKIFLKDNVILSIKTMYVVQVVGVSTIFNLVCSMTKNKMVGK